MMHMGISVDVDRFDDERLLFFGFIDDSGNPATPGQVRAYLADLRARGFEVVPTCFKTTATGRCACDDKNPHAVAMAKLGARKGGLAKSDAKTKAVRENGKRAALKILAGIEVHHEAELAATVNGRPTFIGATPAAHKWLRRNGMTIARRQRGPKKKDKADV